MITLLVLLVILYSLTVSFVKRVSCLGTRQAQVGEDVAFSESLGIELNIYRAEVAPFKNHLVFNSPNPSMRTAVCHVSNLPPNFLGPRASTYLERGARP